MDKKTYCRLDEALDALSLKAESALKKYQQDFNTLAPLVTKQIEPWLKNLARTSLNELNSANERLKTSQSLQDFLALKKMMLREWQSLVTKKKHCETMITKSEFTSSPKKKSNDIDPAPLKVKLKPLAEQLAALRVFGGEIQAFYDKTIARFYEKFTDLKRERKQTQQINGAERSTAALTKRLMLLQANIEQKNVASRQLSKLYLPLQSLNLVSSKLLTKIEPIQHPANVENIQEKQADKQPLIDLNHPPANEPVPKKQAEVNLKP